MNKICQICNLPAEPQAVRISTQNQKEPWFGGPIKFRQDQV
jgi:hypothetical protein